MDHSIDISIVVPVYNGSKSLVELFERTQKTMAEMKKSFQIIFVDDFSGDSSWEVIQELKKTYKELVVGIKLVKNFGQHNATICGIENAQGEFIVTIDDDLEFSPEDISLLFIEQEKTNSDLVYGVDLSNKRKGIRKLLSTFYKKGSQFFEGNEKCVGSSFRLMKKSLATAIIQHSRIFSFIDEFLLWHTSKIKTIAISCHIPKRGKSRYRFLDLISLTRELVLFNSLAPLRFVTLIGTVMMSVNFFLGSIILYRKLILSIRVEGYTSMIVAILFSSGIIIFSLGIIAEYISKLIKMNYGQPAYKIGDKI